MALSEADKHLKKYPMYHTPMYTTPPIARIWISNTPTIPSPLNLRSPLNTHKINDINMI